MLGGYGGCILPPTGTTPPIPTTLASYSDTDIDRATIIGRFIEQAWNASDPADRAAAVQKYVEEKYGYTLGGNAHEHGGVPVNDKLEMQGRDNLLKLIEGCHAAVSYLHVTPDQMMVVEDLVIVRLTVSGRRVRPFLLPSTAVYKVPGERITASWHLLDWQSLAIQP